MRDVKMVDIFNHHITRKYVIRSGLSHAIAVSYHSFCLAKERGLDVDSAAKAGFLHDIGHYTWYKDGKWATTYINRMIFMRSKELNELINY